MDRKNIDLAAHLLAKAQRTDFDAEAIAFDPKVLCAPRQGDHRLRRGGRSLGQRTPAARTRPPAGPAGRAASRPLWSVGPRRFIPAVTYRQSAEDLRPAATATSTSGRRGGIDGVGLRGSVRWMPTAVITALGLAPHPEGGPCSPDLGGRGGHRRLLLLRQVRGRIGIGYTGRAEIWHFYAGATDALTVERAEPGRPRGQPTTLLGIDLDAPQRPQAIVPAGWWQCARTLGEWSLVGCTVAPPFSFDAFEMAPRPLT